MSAKRIEFCLYEPGQEDYWGQFGSQKELFDWMKLVGNFEYDAKSSNPNHAFYRDGEKLIVVTGM